MKKWILFGLAGVVGIVIVIGVIGFVGVRDNDNALEDIRDNKQVVVMAVSGMT